MYSIKIFPSMNLDCVEEKSAPEQNNLDNSTPKYVHDPRLQ